MPQYQGSTTPLTGSGGGTPTFTSQWVPSDFWSNITGAVFTDQPGNCLVDQSGDGVNVDVTTTTAVLANTGVSFNIALVLPYVRVRMTNTSVTAQTVLRLTTRYVAGNTPV